jgi:hypothetical protein
LYNRSRIKGWDYLARGEIRGLGCVIELFVVFKSDEELAA